jgi:hypothetical protein
MFTTRFIAIALLLSAFGLMAAACSTIAPPGYDAVSEQRAADQIEWQNDPWM